MWGGVTVSLALKLRFDASMDDVDFTNLVKHLSDDRGQGLQGSINHMQDIDTAVGLSGPYGSSS